MLNHSSKVHINNIFTAFIIIFIIIALNNAPTGVRHQWGCFKRARGPTGASRARRVE